MVDVSAKPAMRRRATASGCVTMAPATIQLVRDNLIQKGDVLAAARIAAISGAKSAAALIPLCHNIPIDFIDVAFVCRDTAIDITASAGCDAKTGIEMEALTAVAIAALTIYDMCKAVDKQMTIGAIRLVEKQKYDIPR